MFPLFSKRHKRLSIIGIAAAAAISTSLLVASPASAATTLSGTVLDAGVPVSGVSVSIERYNPGNHSWEYYWGAISLDDGTWSVNVSFADGEYATYYDVSSSAAVYSTDQTWMGTLEYWKFDTQFTAAGNVTSTSNLTENLKRNAGIVQVGLTNAANGLPITGGAANGFGELDLYGPYSPSTGTSVFEAYLKEEKVQFDGYLSLGHIFAGTYSLASVQAQDSAGWGYWAEQLDTFSVPLGGTVALGTVPLIRMDVADSADLLPSHYGVAVAGEPKVGALLTAVTPASAASIRYQWFQGDVPIVGATSQTYLPTEKDLGQQLYVKIWARIAGHGAIDFESSRFGKPVQLGDANALAVRITGSAKLNGKLRAHVNGGLPDANTSLQWYRNGAVIADADGSSYVATKADMGKSIVVSAKSTVQGHSDAVIPSPAVKIAQDTAKFTATLATRAVKISVKNGKTGLSSTGKVRVYYTKTKFKTVTVKAGKSATAKLPKLKKGTTTLKVVYQGNSYYAPKTITLKVKVKK